MPYFCYERYHGGWMGVIHAEAPRKTPEGRLVERTAPIKISDQMTLDEALAIFLTPATPKD